MRLLTVGNMYPPHHLGGAELIWRSAVEHARSRGHAVRVLTTDHVEPRPDPAVPDEADVQRRLRWYWRDHGFPRLSFGERLGIARHDRALLAAEVEAFRPDVVVWWSMGGLPMSMLAQVAAAAIPAVGVVLDDWLVYGPAVDGWQRMWRRLGPLGRLGSAFGVPARVDLSRLAEWIFMSRALRDHAAEAGIDVSGSRVVHRGVDPHLFEPGARDRPWRGRLIYVGRVEPRKGIETAVRALASLPAATLAVVGSCAPGYREHLEQVAGSLAVTDRLRFIRVARTQLGPAIADSDALVFPVLWEEPWGLVPLEAMACGTPVVATGAGGSGEYLRHGVNCLLYSPKDDPRALAARLRRLESDDQLRQRLREGGLATVARLDVAAFNDAILDLAAKIARPC